MVPLGETATHCGSRLGTKGAADAKDWLIARRAVRAKRKGRNISPIILEERRSDERLYFAIVCVFNLQSAI
jgi:hypothetical protein